MSSPTSSSQTSKAPEERPAEGPGWWQTEVVDRATAAWAAVVDAFRWMAQNPLQTALWLMIAATLVYFYGFYRVFMNGAESSAIWAYNGWNAENDQQHCVAIMPAVLFLLWYHRDELAAAVKEPSWRGLAFVVGGILMFLAGVRCLEPRMTIVSLPLLVYGAAEFLGGRAFARVFIFPCLLMLFMIPIGGLIQGTISLQLLASKSVGALCALLGIHVQIIGTTIIVDGHPFEVAGGCSGIRSLMAMTMLAALYVHFTQKESWKQIIIFGGSIVFALIGNIVRLFSVVLVAKWYDVKFAATTYHDYSGLLVFFPSAVMAMVAFSNLLNRDWSKLGQTDDSLEIRRAGSPNANGEEKPKAPSPISYDY